MTGGGQFLFEYFGQTKRKMAESRRDKNNEDRMWFVEYWVNYMKTHDDWSRQQNRLINAQLKTAMKNKELYLKLK